MTQEFEQRFRYIENETVRNRAMELALAIDECLPEGREKSLALTNIEQAMLWTTAGTRAAHTTTV